MVYPEAKLKLADVGVILLPSKPHLAPTTDRRHSTLTTPGDSAPRASEGGPFTLDPLHLSRL